MNRIHGGFRLGGNTKPVLFSQMKYLYEFAFSELTAILVSPNRSHGFARQIQLVSLAIVQNSRRLLSLTAH